MSLLAILQISFLFFTVFFIIVFLWLKLSSGNNSSSKQRLFLNLSFIDLILILFLTTSFGYISQINLGAKEVKKSIWQGNYPEKQLELKFPHPTELSKVYYYSGLTNGTLEIDAIRQDGAAVKLEIENQSEKVPFLFMWIIANVPESVGKISTVKFIIKKPLVSINQILLMDRSNKPIANFTINGNIDKVYDQLDSDFIPLDYRPSSIQVINKDGSIWDEIYYVTSAYQLINSISPLYVREHPPLGINIIALSIKLLGMSPFAWRLPASIAGILLTMIVYLFGKQIFERSLFAFLASLLISLDFMHFVFSRIVALESILIVFTTATLLFLYRYFNCSLQGDHSTGVKALLIAGYFWGLALATKWSALFMFFSFIILVIYCELKLNKDRTTLIFRLSASLVAIVLLPLSIYYLSYIPEFINSKETNFYQFVFDQTEYAFYFQTTIMESAKHHFFASQWWGWLILIKPYAIYRNYDKSQGLSTAIVLMGNPAIWWVGGISIFILLISLLLRRDNTSLFILLSIITMYLPYALLKRDTFIYYFYFVTPLITLAIVKSTELLAIYSRRLTYFLVFIYLLYTTGLFVLFYPVLAGETVARSYIYSYLHWFSSWIF